MEQPLVTIVLPIYGVEKYLDRCVSSVVNQTYENLEILLIDDGSPDRCPELCDEWAKKDSRIRVIHKENAGLGRARNTGIEYATGQYICFFDSDDYIRHDAIALAVRQICRDQAELAIFGFSTVASDGRIQSTFIPSVGYRSYRGEAVLTEFLPDLTAPDYRSRGPRRLYMSAWVLMYDLSVIRRSGWRFISEREIIAEDVYSLLDLMSFVESVTVVPEALYFYCMNGTSLSHSYRPDRYLKIRHFYKETLELCRRKGYNDDVLHRVSKPYLAFTLAALKQEAGSDTPLFSRMARVKEIVNDEILQQVLQQNKRDKVSWTRWLIFLFMRRRLYGLTFLLLKVKL